MTQQQKCVQNPVNSAVKTVLDKYFDLPDHEDVYCELAHFFANHPDLSPICIEALTSYVYNQKCVVQEITHPGGEVENQPPPHPDLSLDNCDITRFLPQVKAWYDQKTQQLQRISGDWESWMTGIFSCVERDEKTGETIYWTIRGFAGKTRSTWTLQIEQDGFEQNQCVTFVVADKINSPSKAVSRNGGYQSLLIKTYQTYCQRVNRILYLLQHLHKLGIRSVQEYRTRCKSHGLSPDLLKTVQQRRQELTILRNTKDTKSDSDWFRESVTRIYEGEATEKDLRTDYLKKIARAFAGGLAGGARKAYLDLLLHAEQHANLFTLQPAIPALGPQKGNTFVQGLAELARHYRHWIRPLSDWQPDAYNPQRQFTTLSRHLIVRYDLPTFMDTAWFRGRSALAQQQQGWFLHVAGGQNIRTADIPVTFTKKTAHHFLQAPSHFTIEEALRWGQIVGQGGSPDLMEAIQATLIGESFENEAFWSTVIQFLVANSMLDPDCVGPMVDYIYNRKYVSQEVVNPGGEVVVIPPPEPNFAMKARSITKLLDQVEAWHQLLSREKRAPKAEWDKSPISDYSYTEKDTLNGGALHWNIRELLNVRELKTEGRDLHHCVSSYTRNCQKGATSVWSLQVTTGHSETLRLATIAVNPKTRIVTQLRGKHNLKPSMTSRGLTFGAGLDPQYAIYLCQAPAILRRWASQERLGNKGGDLNAWIKH